MPKRALSDEEGNSPKKKCVAKETKPLDPKKFGGKTEEEVCQMLLPDHLAPGLDVIFMGINPGLYSAYLGHHYCSANNHFWPCLYESGLIPKKLGFKEDAEVLKYGIGMSNIVPRTTRSASELSRKEIKEWSKVMIERMQELKPLIICFNGKGIYEIYTGGKCTVGLQEDPLPGTDTVVYVMPSTSGRAATYPKRSDKLKFFSELKDLRDRLHREREERGRESITTSTTLGSSVQLVNDSNGSDQSNSTSEPSSAADGSTAGPATDSLAVGQLTGDQTPQRVAVIVSTGDCGQTASNQLCRDQRGSSPLQHVPVGGSAEATNKASDKEPTQDTNVVRSPYFHQQNS